MEKMKKIANHLDEMAKISYWVFLFFAGAVLVIGLCVFAAGGSMLTEVNTSVNLGSVKVELLPEQSPSLEIRKMRTGFGLIFCTAIFLFASYAMKVIREILRPMKEALPFSEAVHKNIKKLGILTVIAGIAANIVKIVIETMAFKIYDIPSLFASDKIAGYTLDRKLDVTFVFVAAVLFMLSYIFRYGTELQKLSDETL